jgi:hypothetical protein
MLYLMAKQLNSKLMKGKSDKKYSVGGIKYIVPFFAVFLLFQQQIHAFFFESGINISGHSIQTQTPHIESDSVFTHIKTITIEAKSIQTDRLGNIYVVSKTNQLYKYNSDGKLLSTLNYKYLGNITFVDATNPLEIYVFYKELNMVVFLDNNLAFRGELALNDYNIGQASAIARSFDNGIWIFDLADMQLKKMDKDGANPLNSSNIRQYTNANSAISYLYDNDDRVFVNDSTNGIFIFDVFATYIRTLPIKGCDKIKVIDKELFYHQSNTPKLKKYQLNTFQTTEYSLPDSTEIRDLSIEKNRIYLLKTDEVRIYGF